MVSCGSDNDPDGGNGGLGDIPSLPTPEYENSSAKYEINPSNSPITSIELTASGDYIIIKNPFYYGAPSKPTKNNKSSLIQNYVSHAARTSRADNSPIIYGKFIKISDTEYILEGYGSIVIEGDTANTFSLQITPQNGETTTVAAQKSSTIPDSEINNAICRTWNLDNIGIKMSFNNALVYNDSKPSNQLDILLEEAQNALKNYLIKHYGASSSEFDPYEPLNFYPTKVIFTKSGTYMVEYSNQTIAVSTWHWINESKGQFQFSWDYDDPDSTESGGSQNYVSFKNEKLFVHELHTNEEEGITISSETIYGLSITK